METRDVAAPGHVLSAVGAASASTVMPVRSLASSSSSTSSNNSVGEEGRGSEITLDELRAHFHQPIQTVAAEFGMCVTRLKKLCRARGIERWPQRKVLSLNNMVRQLRATLAAPGVDRRTRARTQAQLRIVLAKKRLLYADPNVDMAITPKTIFVLPPGCVPEPLSDDDGDVDEGNDDDVGDGDGSGTGSKGSKDNSEEEDEEDLEETAVHVLRPRKRARSTAVPVPLVPQPPAPLSLAPDAVPASVQPPPPLPLPLPLPTNPQPQQQSQQPQTGPASLPMTAVSPSLRETGVDFDAYCAAAPQDLAQLPPLTAYLHASPRAMAEARLTRVPLFFARAAGVPAPVPPAAPAAPPTAGALITEHEGAD